jgi:hypothetical protein
MAKSSNSERAQRINAALSLIMKEKSAAKAAETLTAQYGISKRQAYRYIHNAEEVGEKVPVPDQKIPFTVKLSQNIVLSLRQYAQTTGGTLSEIVTRALEAFLHKGQRRGHKGKIC